MGVGVDDQGRRVHQVAPAVREALVSWYRKAHRRLPWRDVRDPYAIWVSEVMLQQTQVRTVIPYFERFMRRFPTLQALAAADLEEVLSLWKGLGYYGRARNLHRGAREAVRRHHGRLPADPTKLERLPGIGRYTAGAVASMAFDVPVPVLDGNVIRVLCRLFAFPQDPSSSAARRRLWRWADVLVPEEDPGTFNQALMELGALVCVRGTPDCGTCPLAHLCEGRKRGDPGSLPVRSPRRAKPEVPAVCLVIREGARGPLLFGRRPPTGLLGGLWELPTGSIRDQERPADAASRVARARFGLDLEPGMRPETVVHVFTHLRLTLYTAVCRRLPFPTSSSAGAVPVPPDRTEGLGTTAFDVPYLEYRWVAPEALADLPVGRATGRVIEALDQETWLP